MLSRFRSPVHAERICCDPVSALTAGATLVGGIMSSNATSDAASTAAGAQTQAAQLGIAQQNKEFEAVQKLLAPYATGGTKALTGQMDLTGLNGNAAQGAAIKALQGSPAYTSALTAGNNSILSAASATGGLRGGNVRGALGQFAPALLASTINDQYGRLGGLSSLGENAAAGTGNAAMATGNNITSLLGGIGSAQAGNALAQGRADTGPINTAGSAFGQLLANPANKTYLNNMFGQPGSFDPFASFGVTF